MTDPAAPRRSSATLYRVILPVADLESAATFYSRVLESDGVYTAER